MQLAVSRVGCRVPIRQSSAVVYVVSFAPSERPPPGIKPPFEGNGRRRRHPKGRLQAGAPSVRLSPPVLPRPTARRVGPAPPSTCSQRAVQPPSITSGAPVNTAARGPRRYATASATSEGSSMRFERLRREEHVLEHALLRHPVGASLICDLLLDERRPHVARADSARADPGRRPLERERLDEPEHAVLRGHVARLERRRDETVDRGDDDDAAVPRLAERAPRVAGEQERAREEQRDAARPSGPRRSSRPATTCWKPALGTSASRRPKRSSAASTAARLPSRVVRSAAKASPGPSSSGVRSTASTSHPSATSRSAIARPIPLAAPVTRAASVTHGPPRT